MNQISSSEIQIIEMGILDYIDSICKRNNIEYTLAYGTLLGAVRHKGFIPWDDDIDICMNRYNFDRFVNACKKENNDKYRLLWLDSESKYSLPLPKVIDTRTVLTQNTQDETMPLGVYVDVFIFDRLPNCTNKRTRFIKRLNLLQRFWGYAQNKYVWSDHSVKSYIRYFIYRVFHLIGPRYFSKLLNRNAQIYNNKKECDYIGSLVYSPKRDIVYPNTLFDDYEYMIFENKLFPVTNKYDLFLKNCYGEYMVLPPTEKRVCHHDFNAYYVE